MSLLKDAFAKARAQRNIDVILPAFTNARLCVVCAETKPGKLTFFTPASQSRALVHQRFNSAKDWHCALMCSECRRLYNHSASKALVCYQALAKPVNRLSSGVANSTPRKPEGLAKRSARLDGQAHRQYRTGGRRQKVTVTRDGKGALVAPFFIDI